MRGTGGIESSVIEAIRRVRDAGFRVIVATCVDRMNAGRLTDTYDLMKGLGVQSWRIASPREAGNWRGTTTGLCLSEEAEACVPLMDRWLKDGKPFYIQLAGFFGGGRKPKGKAAAHAGAGRDERPEYMPESYDCGSCRERPNLLPDGTLVPCPGYVDSIMPERMPNLLREDLSEVWTGSLLREIASIRKKDLLARNPECAACEMFKECGVGCRASALTQTGDLMAKDPTACELWKGGYKKRFQELADGGAERA
jgi:radical SAM protein with 4Fe4S-binding SPASM domain